jgi:hypothetical protein
VSDQGETVRLPHLKSLKDMAKSGAKLDASIVTTYAFNALFYEEVLLRAFERAGSRLNLVLVDATQLAQGMSDPLRRPTRAGADYLLAPIPHVGAFHPKIVALLSEKQPLLAVGSHNATDAGYSHNEELTAFWGLGRTPPIRVLHSAVEYALGWLHVSGAAPSTVLKEMDGRLRGLLPGDQANEEISFLGSRGDASLWAQLRGRVDGAVIRVWVVGPYFDVNLSLVRSIDQELSPKEIIVGIQPGTAVLQRPDLAPANTRFVDAAAMDRFWPEADEVGFSHGKAIAIQTETGLVVSLGSANPTAAAWLSQPIWNAEANLCLLGASASAAFGALGFEGLTQAPALETRALAEIASRSQELRRKEQEDSTDPVAPVLIGLFEEDRVFVAGLQTPERPEVTLHGPEDGEISAIVSPAEGGGLIHLGNGRLGGGAYRLCSGDETLAFVILNDEQALRAASLPRESVRILDHLGALDSTSGFAELLELLDRHVLSKPEVSSNSGPSSHPQSTSKEVDGIDTEVPFGPRGVSLPCDLRVEPRRRRLNEGLIGDIISALIRALGAPPAPSKDGDAPDRDEGVLQLATFLRSLDLFLELTARTVPRTLTANQVQRGGKQGTDGPELSRIHSSTQHPRDKQRQALAPGADQQRLQHSRARQTYRSMLLLVLRCASRRPLTTRQTQYSPSCSALVSSSSASSSPTSDACLARIARRAPHNSKSHLSTRFIGRQDATKIGIG